MARVVPSVFRRGSRLTFESLERRIVLDAPAGPGGLMISEFMAVNDSFLADEDGDFTDWIEIHNPADASMDLDGWYLTDRDDNLTKWRFPGVSLAAGEYLVVFASDKDRAEAGGQLHTNFKLSGNGEYLALVQPDGTTVSHAYAPEYPAQDPDVSYGLGLTTGTLLREGVEATYRVPTIDDAALGTDWTGASFDDTAWVGGTPPSPVLIAEPGFTGQDFIEIQNVTDEPVNTSGWIVALNDADDRVTPADINAVYTIVWNLPPSIAAGEVLYASDIDDGIGHYWGENIFWRTNGSGWAMILKGDGPSAGQYVADFVVWGYSAAELAGFDVTIAGHRVTAEGIWNGDPILELAPDGSTWQRVGQADHDGAADFEALPTTMGQAIVDLVTPFPSGPSTGLGFNLDPPGFGDAIATDVGSEMHTVNASLWTRIPLEIEDPAGLDSLILQMKYNDGFVAYLNGVEIAASNTPALPVWNSSATAGRTIEESSIYAEFDVTEFIGALQPGTNVLAIHGLNETAGDRDFLVLPKLIGADNQGAPQYFTSPTPGARNSAGSVVINEIYYDTPNNAVQAEFIEIHNAGVGAVDLSGWRLSDAVSYAFPASTVLPGDGYLVVAQDPVTLLSEFGAASIGPWIGRLDSEGEKIELIDATGRTVDEVDYRRRFPWPLAAGGDGSSMELVDPLLDNDLGGNWRSSGYELLVSGEVRSLEGVAEAAPTPGRRNNVYSLESPPAVRQVNHDPQRPTTGQPITVTAKVTDRNGVDSVNLSYQLVLPGHYIPAYLPLDHSTLQNDPYRLREPNPEFEDPANWTTVAMVDDGSGADAAAGDGVYTAVIPGQSENRALVRYRITASDRNGTTVTAPLLDDTSLNFAYYVYDGVPSYVADTRSVLGAGHEYDSDVMTSLPVYSLITRAQDLSECYAYNSAYELVHDDSRVHQDARRTYNWEGAFVFEDVVYDHIGYRLRGANGRYYGDGKRAMKFNFNRGNYFQARNLDGELYDAPWSHLTVGKQFGNRMITTWGLSEILNNQMFNLLDVPATDGHGFHFRVVDGEQEAPTGANGQYYGDFWGLFLAWERYDVRFVERQDLPKGNLYKLSDRIFQGERQIRYQAPDAVSDSSDYENIRFNANSSASVQWLRDNVDLDEWYRYHTVTEGIRHYDVFADPSGRHTMKNMVWYFEPDDTNPLGRVQFLPYDTDDTWGPYWNTGRDHIKAALYDGAGKPELKLEYRNVIREFRDLVWQEDVINPWIDRLAAIIEPFSHADRDRWKDAPANAGRQDFGSLAYRVQDMKNFAFVGGSWPGGSVGPGGRADDLDNLADAEGDAGAIPRTPTVTYRGPGGYPADGLAFHTTDFSDPQGNNTFRAMEWRIAEMTDPTAPAYDPTEPYKFEFNAAWESGELTTFDDEIVIPGVSVGVGRTYRARVRMQDNTGRWSHWSDPIELTVGEPANPIQEPLRITEIMYHPLDPTPGELAVDPAFDAGDFEFIELQNTGDQPLNLDGTRFTGGIGSDFTDVDFGQLAPGEFVVLAANETAFAARYGGIPLAGQYTGQLNNNGESIRLTGPFGRTIHEFAYDNEDGWPSRADGRGSSLEVLDTAGDYADRANWRAGSEYQGSPGRSGDGPLGVVINEVLTHTDLPDKDAIELYNPTGNLVDVGGMYLSDSSNDFLKFRIPDGTTVPAGGYLVFDEDDFNPTPLEPLPDHFGLNGAHGDDVWLVKTDGLGKVTHLGDYVEFGAAAAGESLGRWPHGTGELYPMIIPTLDKEHPENGLNSGPRLGRVIISEFHYNPMVGPDDALEFVEVYNTTGWPVDMTDWRIRRGVDFDFPEMTLQAYSTLVVLPFPLSDTARWSAFCTKYGLDPAETDGFLGGYSDDLSNTGEYVQLQRPDVPPADEPFFIPHLLEDEVRWDDQLPWPIGADGGGDSLHRTGPHTWGHADTSWNALSPTPAVNTLVPEGALVVGRHVFYNRSAFDGNDPAANAGDDAAIAPDKRALAPGETASLANYTSYTGGLNGIMIDVVDLPSGGIPDADDFEFRVGNNNSPSGWAAGAAPSSITVRRGVGVNDSDRITLVWNDGDVAKQWLQVTVSATARTGLIEPDVFYFGNAIGEIGNSTTDAKVNAIDMLGARDNQRNFFNPAEIDFGYDFNRDARVNSTDMLIARNNQTHFLNALKLIAAPAGENAAGIRQAAAYDAVLRQATGGDSECQDAHLAKLAWLYEYESKSTQERLPKEDSVPTRIEETLLASL